MKISKLGEFGLIEQVIAPEFKELVNQHITGIGDDCAIMPISKNTSHLHTTDMLIENTHFLRDKIAPYQLGFKCLAVNLSDIAAMGGKPLASYLSIALPKDMDVEWMEEFMRGYKDLSEDEDVPLLGGDTTSSQGPIVINVGVTGEINNQHIKKRSDGRPGDILCLSGEIGDSAGGLQVILDALPEDPITARLLDQHLTPYPHVSEGLWLARHQGVHAMIDVSDGIGSDLQHILKASNVKGFIELEQLPISAELRQQAGACGWNAMELAISGGEDYVLLLSMDANQYEKLSGGFRREFGRSLHPIGHLSQGDPVITYMKDKQEVKDLKEGYRHF
ncbi:MAG: thiamine-phosphate kinase [Bacteroidales bacterium]|nr:thiamine-phosphate kinase [Bacteroidales bacterium]